MTDEEYMARVVNGDQEAFQALYDRHSGILLGLIFKIVGNRQTAEEILQETFWKVWNKSESYDNTKASFRTWLFSIARRGAIDSHRRATVRPTLQGDEMAENVLEKTESESNVLGAVFGNERRQAIKAALAQLSAEQRTVVEMAYFSGLTRREIASEQGIPLGTVHTRARLALQKLHGILNEGEWGTA